MKIINKIILLAFISINAFASGGSIYTRYGKGDVINFYFARQMAMGGGGASLIESNNIYLYNPASIAGILVTRIETGLNSTGISLSNNTSSAYYNRTQFSGVSFAIPLERDYGIALSLGILPVTSVNYAVQQHMVTSDNGEYDLSIDGLGGISKLFVGTSYKLPFGWVLGAEYEYYTGKIDHNSKLEFPIDSNLKNAEFNSSNGHHGMGASFGLISSDLSSIFGNSSISDFRIGAFLNYYANLHTDSVITTTSAVGAVDFEGSSVITNLPNKFGMGASFRVDHSYLFIFDFLYQPWSDFEISGIKSDKLKDYYRYSLGFEYKSNNRKNTGFWQQIAIRAGLSYENTQYRINDKNIDQFALHAGIGMPITFSNSLDIGFMAGIRGAKENNLIQEKFYKLSVSLSFGELWFIRQER